MNFLQDLSRLEKELSFESVSCNIYEESIDYNPQLQSRSKVSSCLRQTNEDTDKALGRHQYDDYYGPLIIDFSKPSHRIQPSVSQSRSQNLSNALCSSRSINRSSNSKKPHFYRPIREKVSSKQKNTLARPSKSKSHHKYELSSTRSQKNIHMAPQESLSSKVFTEYYGTDINPSTSRKSRKHHPEPHFQTMNLKSVRSPDKVTSRSKKKTSFLSPKTKVGKKHGVKK